MNKPTSIDMAKKNTIKKALLHVCDVAFEIGYESERQLTTSELFKKFVWHFENHYRKTIYGAYKCGLFCRKLQSRKGS